LNISQIKYDCRYFKGHIPCKPHKQFGVHCTELNGDSCQYYDQISFRVLIIKLGAIGDVIRTTPLYAKLKEEFPTSKIYWLTETSEVIPKTVDEILNYNFKSVEYIKSIKFDLAINLDKDYHACALFDKVHSKLKKGFILENGIIKPINISAEQKFLTGLFDDISKDNTKTYLEEIFEISGFEYKGEKYILDPHKEFDADWKIIKKKGIIGLNTGCGDRWTSRLWKEEYWEILANSIINIGYQVVFLGGEAEDNKNRRLSEKTGGIYTGYFQLEKFISLINNCDLVVTAVTMAMHITLALGKKLVLFNNIFNKNEFELFGLGEIIEPSINCDCYFNSTCPNNCMDYIEPERVLKSIKKLL
jgi:heptosyltransferase-2